MSIDDILRIVKTTKEENPDLEEGHTIHLVVSADDLKGMFFNLKKVGYEPGVNFDCRRLSALYLKFNGLNITIKSQQLVSTILDGDIALEDEAIYNKTTEAMTLFHTALFRTNLKSYYNKEDIDILDEYRTKANIGMIKKISNKEPMVEIGFNKSIHRSLPIHHSCPNFQYLWYLEALQQRANQRLFLIPHQINRIQFILQ